jgi:hypothetical protein
MRIKAILSATVLAGAALAAVPMTAAQAAARTADASGGVGLPLNSFFQLAVDNTHDHLFFSQGNASENSILVTNFAGSTVATIANQNGVMGIALSPDGKTLYAALSGLHEVSAISTATLKQTAVYPLGDGNTPVSVAVQSGKLLVSYNTAVPAVGGNGVIGYFNLSAASPTLATSSVLGDPPDYDNWYSAPMLAADPAGVGNVVVATQAGLPTNAATYDTAANPVRRLAGSWSLTQGPYECGEGTDTAVVPGGAQFIPACDSEDTPTLRYSTEDLSGQGGYATPDNPDAIAIASGTGLVAIGVNNSVPDIFVYAPGGDTPLNVLSAGSYGLAPGGLALSADGSRLFALALGASVSSGLTGGYRLYSDTFPAHHRSSLTLTGTASVPAGHPLTLRGTLSAGGASSAARASIEIIRTGPDGSKTWWVSTGSNGTFSATDTPPGTGAYFYVASYAGTASVTPGWARANVTATPPGTQVTPSLTISASPAAATYRPTVHVAVHLGLTGGNRTVSVYAKTADSTKQTLLKSAAVNSAGNLTLTYTAAHTTAFSAVYGGDAQDTARTATTTATVAARVTAALAGYYASRRIGTVTYRVYHHTAKLTAAITVAPGKAGECVKLQVEEYAKGTWHSSLTGCGKLNSRSQAVGLLVLTHATLGPHYRVRLDYLPGTDPTNIGADSAWQYFIVAK